jgi:hypothetical protein
MVLPISRPRRFGGPRLLIRTAAVAAAILMTLATGARPAQAALDIYVPAGTWICVYYVTDHCNQAPSGGFHAAAHCYGHYPYLPIDGDDVWTKFSGNGYSNWFVPKAQTGPRRGLPRCPGTVGP